MIKKIKELLKLNIVRFLLVVCIMVLFLIFSQLPYLNIFFTLGGSTYFGVFLGLLLIDDKNNLYLKIGIITLLISLIFLLAKNDLSQQLGIFVYLIIFTVYLKSFLKK